MENNDFVELLGVPRCSACTLPHVYPVGMTTLDVDTNTLMYWCPIHAVVGTMHNLTAAQELEYMRHGGPVAVPDDLDNLDT